MMNTKDEAERWQDYRRFLAEWAGTFGLLVSRTGTMPLREAFDLANGDEARNLATLAADRRRAQ